MQLCGHSAEQGKGRCVIWFWLWEGISNNPPLARVWIETTFLYWTRDNCKLWYASHPRSHSLPARIRLIQMAHGLQMSRACVGALEWQMAECRLKWPAKSVHSLHYFRSSCFPLFQWTYRTVINSNFAAALINTIPNWMCQLEDEKVAVIVKLCYKCNANEGLISVMRELLTEIKLS